MTLIPSFLQSTATRIENNIISDKSTLGLLSILQGEIRGECQTLSDALKNDIFRKGLVHCFVRASKILYEDGTDFTITYRRESNA